MVSPISNEPGTQAPLSTDRGPDESSRAYRAFCIYRDLGPYRSIDRAWKISCSETDPGNDTVTSSRHPGCWGEWSNKFNWVERAGAHDDAIELERLEAAAQTRRELKEQRSKFECEAQSRTEDRVRNLDAVLDKLSKASMHDGGGTKCDPITHTTTTTSVPGLRPRDIAVLTKVRNETTKFAIHGFGDGQLDGQMEEGPPRGRINRIVLAVPDAAHDKAILSAKVDEAG
jgi:hypothetical protein